MLRQGRRLILGLVAIAALAQPALAAEPVAKPILARWEYRLITYNRVALFGDSEAELKLLGLQGWELVSAIYDPNGNTIVCFLKRPFGGVVAPVP